MLDLKLDEITGYLDIEEEDVLVNNLLDKYNLSQQNGSFLYGTKDEYHVLIDFIITLFLQKKEIPSDIIDILKNNLTFKTFLLQEIKHKMNKIIHDSSTILFKELVSIINLLSLGKDYDIFTSYNFYSLDNISKLFRDYEDNLLSLEKDNIKNFELTFNYYITLIETFNELCILNQTDVLRKKTIQGITETLTETINMIKFKVTLSDEKINVLNNILGKLLFYYSHIPYVTTDNKELKYIIDEHDFLFEKLTDGYVLSKNTNFGNCSETQKETYYLVYLNSVSTLLLTLFYKLEAKFKLADDFYDLQKFSQLIEHYQENCTHTEIEDFGSLSEFKKCLLNNYVYIYNKNTPNTSVHNFTDILYDMIKSKSMSSDSMSMIRNIILYSNDIDEKILINIFEILLEIPKVKNDYFEFFKLNIIDIIITKFTYKRSDNFSETHVKLVVDYVQSNKVASHLMAMYSKIYLTLALFYSYKFDSDSHEKSKDYYFGYLNITGNELLECEYKDINEKILTNYGKMQINDLEIEDLDLSTEKYIEIGKKLSNNYNKFKEVNLKFEINQNLSNIITHIFTEEGLDNDTLNKEIEYFISQKIFYGLIFSTIDGLCERECRLHDIGYEKVSINLIDGYTLNMAYSNVYKHTFEKIYSQNKDFIKQNVINILISYIKSIPLYIDAVTNLDNKNKLEKDLLLKNEEEIVFIEVYLDSLLKVNESNSFDKANKYFRNIATKLNSLEKTYRTNGPRLGILLDTKSEYKNIVEEIQKLNVDFNNQEIKFDCTIAVSWGNSSNIIEKSHHALLLASKQNNKYYEFK